MAGPCTACRDPGGGAVAATPKARPRGSHTAGCWSAGDCGGRRGGGGGGAGGGGKGGKGGGRQVGRTGWRRNNRFEDGETEAGWVEEGEVRVQIDQSIVQTATDERNSSPPRPQCVPRSRRCHLQGPELRHVVETGHRQSADVVVVEGAGEREERETQQQTDSLDSSRLSHEHREVTESAK